MLLHFEHFPRNLVQFFVSGSSAFQPEGFLPSAVFFIFKPGFESGF
jgi:excinuclease UvrABC helicase subunit UvrB